jgi:chromate transporter
MEQPLKKVSLWEILRTFLVIGATGFGGGMAIVALVERRCVQDKKWLGHDEFMHGLAFGQILGPFSLNISTFVGYSLRGIAGGLIAAFGFIAPSFCLVSTLAWLYFRYNEVPELKAALLGSNPVVIALILVAGLGMARKKVTGLNGGFIAAAAFAGAAFFHVSALTILVLAGCWAVGKGWFTREHA